MKNCSWVCTSDRMRRFQAWALVSSHSESTLEPPLGPRDHGPRPEPTGAGASRLKHGGASAVWLPRWKNLQTGFSTGVLLTFHASTNVSLCSLHFHGQLPGCWAEQGCCAALVGMSAAFLRIHAVCPSTRVLSHLLGVVGCRSHSSTLVGGWCLPEVH